MNLPNIALVGYMRSGKDSVAACLRQLDPHMRKLTFAGALKREVAVALNSTLATGEKPYTEGFFNEDANRPKFRSLLQWWGTDYRRAQDPDYWVKQTKTFVDDPANKDSSWVCTDGRFINELLMLRNKGFKIIHLDMDVEEVTQYLRRQMGMSREDIEKQLGHQSEREWQSFGVDATFRSQFGNLPRLTMLILASLVTVSQENVGTLTRQVEDFYAELYPKIYRTP